MKKSFFIALTASFLFLLSVGSSFAQTTPDPSYPRAECKNREIHFTFLNPSEFTGKSRTDLRINDLTNDWNSHLYPEDVEIRIKDKNTYVHKAVPGRWYGWWVHRYLATGIEQAKGSYIQCPEEKISAPSSINHSYSYPTVTLKWNPVPGAKYYAIRVDNMKTPWNGDKNNLHEGDHLRNQMTETTFTFSAPKGRAISWWVHAISESGQWTDAKGETFVTPEN